MAVQCRLAKSETAAGNQEGIPTFVQRGSRLDGTLQLTDGKPGVQHAMELPAEYDAPRGVELLVSEVLYGKPDESTEGHQRGAAEAIMSAEQERQPGQDAGESVQDEDNLAHAEAAGQKTVVNVAAVGAEDALVAERAARDR